jgi:hypothetical protein
MEIIWVEWLGINILAVKINNRKLVGKLGSDWINNNNIFHSFKKYHLATLL